MKKSVIVIVVVLLALAGAFLLMNNSDESANTDTQVADSSQTANDTPAETQPESTTQTATADEGEATTISYTADGFNPSTLTVKAGTTITVKNNSSRILQFSSDPHPEHTEEPELNLDNLAPGKSATFTAGEAGTYGFHNHLDDDHTGTLTVQ